MFDEAGNEVTGAVEGDVYIVKVTGDIDVDNAARLREALAAAARAGLPRTVVDLSGLVFADSTVLHVLLDAQREHRSAGRRLVVAGPFGRTVGRLFDVTGTLGFFVIAPTVEAAVTS
ncbi:STAS domain-containing protein [Streptomyces sp. NPDC058595]|uniref:STAS domain-containing protein n=1 Tax=Streptomyces sp. NPDC058595 TaxID=3346550 RepID=UPI00366900AA